MAQRWRALDLFAGCGGASLGLVRAGLDVVAAYDFEASAVAAHRALLPDCPVHEADLSDPELVLPPARVWWASPPCQAWSNAGARLGVRDPRNGYPWLLALLDRSPRPEWLFVENVPGLAQHTKHCKGPTVGGQGSLFGGQVDEAPECAGCYLDYVLGELRKRFAHVSVRILDAADYGVPQHRKRLITVCGPAPYAWPVPSHGPGAQRPWVTAGETLGARVFGGGTNPHGKGKAHERTIRDLTNEPSTVVPAVDAGNNSIYLEVGGPNASGGYGPTRSGLDEPAPTVTTRAQIAVSVGDGGVAVADAPLFLVAAGLQPDGRTCEGRARDLDRPATASGGGTMQLVRPKGSDTYHRVRTLTVAERALLQGLPPHPSLTGRAVGNAVPPQLAEALLRALLLMS